MNFVDVLIILLVVLAVFDGWRAGILAEIVDLIGFGLAMSTAFWLFEPFAAKLEPFTTFSPGLAPFLSFFSIVLVVSVAFKFWSVSAVRKLTLRIKPEWLNRFGGSLFGFGTQLIGVTILVNLLLFLPVFPFIRTGLLHSALAQHFVTANPRAEAVFSRVVAPAVYQAQQFITTKEIDDNPVTLTQPVTELSEDAVAEQTMFALVNEERRIRGLHQLSWDEASAQVGRLHSRDMWRRQYFAHINPDGADPFDRLRQGNVKHIAAAENLAVAPTTPIAHEGLMNSPSHYQNIVSTEYTKLGIGVIRNGLYGATYTQLFTN